MYLGKSVVRSHAVPCYHVEHIRQTEAGHQCHVEQGTRDKIRFAN